MVTTEERERGREKRKGEKLQIKRERGLRIVL